MRVDSGEVISAKAVGVAYLNFRNKFLFLNNVFFIPGLRRNLIYVSMLHEQLFSISFINNEIFYFKKWFKYLSCKTTKWVVRLNAN